MEYQKFIDLAKKKGFTNIQITIETGIVNEVYYVNDNLEDYSDINKTTYNIKGEYNNKIEEVYTEYLDESILDLLIEKIELVDTNYENEFLMSRAEQNKKQAEVVSVKDEIKKVNKLYSKKEEYNLVKTIELFFSDEYLETRIINDKKTDIATSSHCYKFITEAVAEKEGTSVSFGKSILVTNKDDINYEQMVKEVLENAEKLSTQRKLETKKYNVIIDSKVVAAIMRSFKNMISAQQIHKKVSCLENKINEKIFSNKLTIVEEPQNDRYPGYIEFDKEGTETYNKVIVENGILKTYLYDNKEAKVVEKNSTGNNYGNISTRNMYITPSEKTLDELLKEMNDGIYITEKMGAENSSISESTGNISIQIFGFIVENGKLVAGFTPAVMSTTIFELLSNIELIGNDLRFTSKDVGAPSLYIKDISIAAE